MQDGLARLRATKLPLLGEVDQEIMSDLLDECEAIDSRHLAELK